MGPQAVADRFAQIEPKVLIATDGVRYAGKSIDRGAVVGALRADLPSVQAVILLESPHAGTKVAHDLTFAKAIARNDAAVAAFEPEWLAFDHPLWVLNSSGTTGPPKAIVHSHGGVLMTAYSVMLHMDIGAAYDPNTLGERYHWFTSTGWVMWNSQVGGLLKGATICLYDGSPSGPKETPDWGVLFRFAARNRVTVFGSGAAYYANVMKAGLNLVDCGNLSAIRVLGSTGSPLAEDVEAWGTAQFAAIGTRDIWWCNMAGGTDLCGNFCNGNRELPSIPGQMQCRQLGASVEAWSDAGQPVTDQVGELVCTRPIPGMPLYFLNDPDRKRLLASYFDLFPGVWRHGDWLKITPDGGCIIYGRSDATINRHGVRMGASEIYSAVEPLPEVMDTMVIDLEYLGQDSHLALFVVLAPGLNLDEALKVRINAAIRSALSPRFLPDEIVQAPQIPRTLSGKKQEVPVKKLFLGHAAKDVINTGTMTNPEVMDWYVARAREHRASRPPVSA